MIASSHLCPPARDLRSTATRRPPRDEKSGAHSPPPVANCEVSGETTDPQPPEGGPDAADPSHSVRMVPEATSGQAPRRCTGFPCSAPMKSRVVAPIHRRLIGCEPARQRQRFRRHHPCGGRGLSFRGGPE